MTFANDGFLPPPPCFVLATSPPSPSQPGMQPCLGTHTWSPDLWSNYYTPNHCTSPSKHHDSPTFDPTCIWATAPANLAPSAEVLKHIYPSPPPTDSDPKHTDTPAHAAGTSPCPHTGPLTLPCTPTPFTPDPERPLTSHPSNQDLPLSPPPSLPMVPHALPEATTSCCTLDKDIDARSDADVEPDSADSESQSSSSSSPDEPPPSDLLTPLSPMWDLPLDEDDTRPAGSLEVSTLLSRPLVSPLPRFPAPGVQATEGDRMTLPYGSNGTVWDLDSKVESHCGQLRPFVMPPDGLSGARFAMFQTFFSPPTFDGLQSDGFLSHSHPSSGGKLFIEPQPFLLSDAGSPHVTVFVPPSRLRRRISLPPPIPEEIPTDTRDVLVSRRYEIGTPHSFGATIDDISHCASVVPVSHKGTKPSAITRNLLQEGHSSTLEGAPPSLPLGFVGSCVASPSTSTMVGSGLSDTSDPGPMMDELDADTLDHSSLDLDDSMQDAAPPSPLCRTMSEFGDRSAPESPSRRSFTDLPDTTMDEQLTSPSPLLSGPTLLTLPGAEPDNTLITAEPSVTDCGLGLFVPIQAASSNESHAIEPNLNFSLEAIALLKSMRRRIWEDEVFHAKRAEHLASRFGVSPPRGGETEGPPGEPAQLDESDEKTIRTWHLRKREKELGRELQALLCLKLGEDPDATEGGLHASFGRAKIKPGKTAIVSMPQLRRDTPRPFSPRKHDSPYISSPLSKSGLTAGEL
ncbi:hypothetical protein BJV77DRAFT_1001288 [Russula vinacea]|nr:hypothetical protein BJV77DRAFT_1001288 [Russula vinacea]